MTFRHRLLHWQVRISISHYKRSIFFLSAKKDTDSLDEIPFNTADDTYPILFTAKIIILLLSNIRLSQKIYLAQQDLDTSNYRDKLPGFINTSNSIDVFPTNFITHQF